MRRILHIFGSLLMVAGIALLVYVGIAYVQQQRSRPVAQGWSASEKKQGRQIAESYAKHQKISIPKSLAGSHLPPAGTEQAVRIVIPKIGVDAPIVQTAPVNGVWEVADWAVGHLTTTPNPGAVGNMALSAHDDIMGELFKRVDELKPGDTIKIYTRHSVFDYIVYNQQIVDPSDVAVLNPTTRPVVTLISCTPYWVDTQRLIIQAALKSRAAA